MPILFPGVKEVPLAAPPLDEVICQVRFPSILRITNEEPVEFQELIRKRFPGFEKGHSFQLKLSKPGNSAASSAELQPTTYTFTNTERQAQAILSPGFYAVSAKKYNGWRTFREDLEIVHSAVMDTYQPAYSTRVGLRYINRLTLENTGTVSREELFGLIRSELTSTLRGKIWKSAETMLGIVNFADPPAQLNLRYGFEVDESASSFLLDLDYFEEGHLELADALGRCEEYHEAIYRAFRYVMKDKALERFGGTSL